MPPWKHKLVHCRDLEHCASGLDKLGAEGWEPEVLNRRSPPEGRPEGWVPGWNPQLVSTSFWNEGYALFFKQPGDAVAPSPSAPAARRGGGGGSPG
jgi:hypothetical protein